MNIAAQKPLTFELSESQLRTAIGVLIAVAAKPAEGVHYHPFPYTRVAPFAIGEFPAHRCLSVAEARIKIQRSCRLFRQGLDEVLKKWEQLSAKQIIALRMLVLEAEKSEWDRSPDEPSRAWYRLDDLLFGLTSSAWINGANFAVTPPPELMAQRLGVDLPGFKIQLEQLRWNLAYPSIVEPRVDLWLGDPPSSDRFPWGPRLWVSARRGPPLASEAAAKGLCLANTTEEIQKAREVLCRRWVERDEAWGNDTADHRPNVYQTVICRWCGETNKFRVLGGW